MKFDIKKIIKIDLFKVGGLNAILIVFRVTMSFILSKFLAIMVGPSGLATIGQLTNTIQVMMTSGSLASNQAVTKYTSEYKDKPEVYFSFIISTLKAIIIASLVVAVFIFFGANWLSYNTFNSYEYTNIYRVFALNISLFALNGLLLSIINGKKLYKKYFYINISISLITTMLTVGLAWVFGLFGALISYVIAQSIILMVTIFLMKAEVINITSNFRKYKLDPKWIKILLTFSFMTFVSMLLSPISKFFVRNEIIDQISMNAAGIWEGMNKITALFLMFFTSIIPIYYLPRLSETKSNNELRNEVFFSLKIAVPVVILAAIVMYLLRYIVVSLALSEEFLPMTELLGFQLIGEVLRVISLLFSFALIAKAKVKHFVYIEVICVAIYMFLAFLFVTEYGLIGSIYAYIACYSSYAILAYILFVKNFSRTYE